MEPANYVLSDIESCRANREAYEFVDEYLAMTPSRQELIDYLGNPKHVFASTVMAAMADREYPVDVALAGVLSAYLHLTIDRRTQRMAALALASGGDDSWCLLSRVLPGLAPDLRDDLYKLLGIFPG